MEIDIPGFGEVPAGREPLPEGRYTVKIVDLEQTTSSKGNDMLVFEAEVVEPEEYAGRKVWWRCVLTSEALWNLKACCEAAEIPYHDNGFATEDALGRMLDVRLTVREYKDQQTGEKRESNDVAEYLPVAS